ncbi:MAG TPA: hypothetical protein VKE98_08685 [Gemmataceae bacterium]|nr:hypothetical protein [Gemmataceae bacterium]
MDTVYLICAVAGGTMIVCQFLLTLLGLGGNHDTGGHVGLDVAGHDLSHDAAGTGHDTAHDSEPNWFLSMLTIRTLSAALAFFGLAGSAASHHLEPLQALGIAILAGAVAFFFVGWMLRLLTKLNVDGSARIERAVGSRGTVYLSIPAARAGVGKVHVSLLNRTHEYKAITSKEESLPTGAKIVVVSIVSADTVEVAPFSETERNSHV